MPKSTIGYIVISPCDSSCDVSWSHSGFKVVPFCRVARLVSGSPKPASPIPMSVYSKSLCKVLRTRVSRSDIPRFVTVSDCVVRSA